MSNQDFNSINEQEFENLLQNSLDETELPPTDIVTGVTPWRKAMKRILWGLALTSITLNFWWLNYILPLIGILLLLLGFRTLRRENAGFRGGWICTLIRSASFLSYIVLSTTVWREIRVESGLAFYLSCAESVVVLVQIFCLWRGIRAVQAKSELPVHAKSAVALMLWYVAAILFPFLYFPGAFLILVIVYICIIRSLHKLSKELDEAGYTIETAPVRMQEHALVATILGTLVLGMICGYVFGGSYAMDWQPVDAVASEQVESIRAHLLSLGFPEDVLSDLTEEDILACEGALRVFVEVNDHPVNDGRRITEQIVEEGKIIYSHSVVYDVKELRITGIAVELPGERETWKLFHHFRWTINPGFYGTECIDVTPTDRTGLEWMQSGAFTGQLLYDRDGQTYAAPYHSLGTESYRQFGFGWGESDSLKVFGAFSLPTKGENQRGYVSYSAKETRDGCILDSWFSYTHQRSWAQFPAETAKGYVKRGGFSSFAFKNVDDAIQFYPFREFE